MDTCPSHQDHEHHLCKLTSEGMHRQDPQAYMGLVRDPHYVCKSCGRVAAEQEHLCNPVRLGTWEE